MLQLFRLILISLISLILCSCNSSLKTNEQINDIPMILFESSENNSINAVLYELKLPSIDLIKKETIFHIENNINFTIPQWNENNLIVSGDIQLVESTYKNKIEKIEHNFYKWKFKDFTVIDKKDFNYSISYKDLNIDINLKNFEDFKNKNSCYFINGDIVDNSYIRMIFKSYDDMYCEFISILKYNLNSKNIEINSFEFDNLEYAFTPSDNILDNEKLYISHNNSFGYIDLNKEEYINLSNITEDMNKFILEKVNLQPEQSVISPVGKVGSYIVVNNPVIYISENNFVRLIGVYKNNEPICKILVDNSEFKLYNNENVESSTKTININNSNGVGYIFPIY